MRRTDLETTILESLWLELSLPKSNSILIGTWYRKPDVSPDFMDSFRDAVERISNENKDILLTGDYNCDFKTSRPNSETKKIKGIFRSFQLFTTGRLSHNSNKGELDAFWSDSHKRPTQYRETNCGPCDHDLVLCVREIKAMKFAPRKIECRDYRHYSADKLCASLKQIDWDPVKNESDTNTAWVSFKEKFK